MGFGAEEMAHRRCDIVRTGDGAAAAGKTLVDGGLKQ
jgi:hypothetical protein